MLGRSFHLPGPHLPSLSIPQPCSGYPGHPQRWRPRAPPSLHTFPSHWSKQTLLGPSLKALQLLPESWTSQGGAATEHFGDHTVTSTKVGCASTSRSAFLPQERTLGPRSPTQTGPAALSETANMREVSKYCTAEERIYCGVCTMERKQLSCIGTITSGGLDVDRKGKSPCDLAHL